MDILIFVVILGIFAGAGRKLFSYMLPNTYLSFLEEGVVSFSVGAGSVALLVLSIGLFGLLYRWVLIVALAGLGLFCRKEIADIMKGAGRWFAGIFQKDFTAFEKFILVMLLLVSLFTLVGSLSPILGMDSTAYHMQDAKLFVQQHRVTHIPYTRESLWPFLVQMLFALGLCLKGVTLAKLFHFAFFTAAVTLIYVLCRRYWPRPNSILAAAVFALTPAIFKGTTYAYTDLAVAFYSGMAFYGFFAWLDTSRTRWFCFSGVMSGFLLGIKITSASVPAVILVLYLIRIFLSPEKYKRKMITPLLFILALIAVCGVWYLRSWLILGNPIYPFAGRFFGGEGYPASALGYEDLVGSGVGRGFRQFFQIPWLITVKPGLFGGEYIGFIYLIFLPMLVFARKRSRFINNVLPIAFLLYAAWFNVYQHARFFYPTLVFLSILVAFVYYDVLGVDPVLRKIGACVLVGSFLFSVALSVYHNSDKLSLLLKRVAERDYLLQHERSFAVADYVNTHLPKDAKVIMCTEPRLYYFERDIAIGSLIWMDYCAGKHRKPGQTLEDYAIAAGYGDYVIDMQDLSEGGSPGPTFWAKELFSGYKKTLIKQIEFKYRDEHYIYQIMKVDVNSGPKTKRFI